MNLKLMLPAVKYKDIRAGQLFTTSRCHNLFAMTFEKIQGGSIELPVAVCLTDKNNEAWFKDPIMIKERLIITLGSLMQTFGVLSEMNLAQMDCYLVGFSNRCIIGRLDDC